MKIDPNMNWFELMALINLSIVHDSGYAEIGQILLEKGLLSDSIKVLSGINYKYVSWDELDKVINNIFIENNWKKQSTEDSVMILIIYLVKSILLNSISPIEACQNIYLLYKKIDDSNIVAEIPKLDKALGNS